MKKLNVFGMEIIVKRANVKDQGFVGLFEPGRRLITLDCELKGEELIQTELHEFFHAVFHRLAITQTNIGANLQEVICDGFATALVENYRVKGK